MGILGKLSTKTKILAAIWILFALGILTVYIIFVLIANGKIGYLPPIEELQNPKNKFATEIYSSDMKVLGRYFQSKENRVFVPYDELSPNLVNALIATEDSRYRVHSGIDSRALSRVVVKTVILQQKNAGGGSTITQQLAKQLYSPKADNFFDRAIQKPIEWVIASKLEKYYTKNEIISMYFNKFDFLNNAVGIKSAAEVYFSTSPEKLKIEEAALLVGMCKNPAYFNPVKKENYERCKGRRDVVIGKLQEIGYITEAERDSLQNLEMKLSYQKVDHKLGLAPYFREQLRKIMTANKPIRSKYPDWMDQKYYEDSLAWETNPLYGWCNKNKKPDGSNYDLYTDGLKIYTTIDSRMQQYAEEAVREYMGGYLQPLFLREKSNQKSKKAPFSNKSTQAQVDSILVRSMRQSDRYKIMKRNGANEKEIKEAFNTPTSMKVFSWDGGSKDTTLSPMDSIRYLKSFLRSGMMSIDPFNGHVKAYVGG